MGLYECITSIITKTTLGILPPQNDKSSGEGGTRRLIIENYNIISPTIMYPEFDNEVQHFEECPRVSGFI
jgi:hypothetical protein